MRIQDQIDRLRRRNGTRRIKSVLELKITDNNPPAESPLESRAAIAIREGGLPTPVAQFRVFDGRTFVGRVDFAWPNEHVLLEVDGFSVHGDRAAWERDRRHQSRLAASGWRVHHVTNERLADPRPVIAELRRSLGVH